MYSGLECRVLFKSKHKLKHYLCEQMQDFRTAINLKRSLAKFNLARGLQIQWGLEYRTCSVFRWLSLFGSRPQPFKIRTMASLGHFIYTNKFDLYIKRPRLE